MADLIYVAVIVGFFALSALFVRACDHIIGTDDTAAPGTREPAPQPKVKAEVGTA